MKNNKKVSAPVEEQEPKYVVSNNHISWKYRRGVIDMTVDDLDGIFYQYSKHGLNMSQVQVQNKHGLNALQWQSLKRTFDLVKDSDVFSPYSLSLVSEKDACDMIARKIAEKYSPKNMRAVIEYEDGKQRKRAYNEAIKKVADLEFRRQVFEDGLLEYVAEAKVSPTVKKSKDIKDGNAVVHVCDLHGGAKIDKSRNLPAYGYDVIVTRLRDIAEDVNSRKPQAVCLVINGDLIETFTGLNHINSWKNIDDKDGYGMKATIKMIEILKTFISAVNNVNEVVFISGNHDRVTSNNKEDVEGEVVRMICFVINGYFGKKFKVSWSEDVVSRKIDGCGFVFTHGHLKLSKKNPELIVNQHGFRGLYNLVVMAHLHSRKITADNYDNRIVHAPSIFTGNNFSKGLGYSSRAGYLYITVKNKLPLVIDCPLT